jgi:hypothetical protein
MQNLQMGCSKKTVDVSTGATIPQKSALSTVNARVARPLQARAAEA